MTDIRVKEHKDLRRDPASHAIINTNKKAYMEAVARHKRAKEQNERMNKLENQVEDLSNKMDSLIDMFKASINNKEN